MDFLISGLVSAFALALAVFGLVPFGLILMNLRGATFSRHSVDVLNGITVLYVYLVGGAALVALGGWVLAVQDARNNILGFLMVAGVLGWRVYTGKLILPKLSDWRRKG